MSVLVVGGAGYIGSHVCKALKESNFKPVVYDNLSTGHSWAVQFGPFIQGDLENLENLASAFDEVRPQAVIHLASLINVRDSIADPLLYWEKNLINTLNLFKVMVQKNVKRVVFSSTAAIYGAPLHLPMDELHPKVPLNAYGKTKWAIEEMLQDFSHAYGLEFAALRYFNACGATKTLGEAHDPETHLIPLVIQTAMGKRNVLKIYGDDYPTPDGTAIRDYIHVSDLAEAHLLALKSGYKTLQLNLGTGIGYSVKEIINAVEAYGRCRVPIEIAPRLPHDSPQLVANPNLAEKMLGFRAKHSDLATIISTAWDWELNRSDQNNSWP